MIKHHNKLLVMSLIFGLLTISIIFGEGGGLILTIMAVYGLFMTIISHRTIGHYKAKRAWFLLVSLILLSATFIIRDQVSLHALNVLVYMGLFIVYNITMTKEGSFDINQNLIIGSLEQFILPFGEFKVPLKLITGKRHIKKLKQLSPQNKQILIGLSLGLPVLIIFTILLASADEIFKSFISVDLSIFDNLFDSSILPKVILFVLSFLYIFSFFHYLLFVKKNPIEEKIKESRTYETVITTIILLVNVLFMVFTFIQIRYLFINDVIEGMTYSSYARKGFFELTAISIMVILMTLIMSRLSQSKLNKLLMSFMNLMTLVIAYSAIFRLNLYINVYGYTWLRIISSTFIWVQMAILFSLIAFIWFRKHKIYNTIAVIYLVFYLCLNFANIDAYIVEKNMDRYFAGHELDTAYLHNLSYDSVGSLIKYEKKLKGQENHKKTYHDIKNILDYKEQYQQEYRWIHFNYSQYQGQKKLKDRS